MRSGRSGKACWKGAVRFGLFRDLLRDCPSHQPPTMSPMTTPLTPPSGLLNVVERPNRMASKISPGTCPVPKRQLCSSLPWGLEVACQGGSTPLASNFCRETIPPRAGLKRCILGNKNNNFHPLVVLTSLFACAPARISCSATLIPDRNAPRNI